MEDLPERKFRPPKPLQEVRAGFTILGDEILGYQPMQRRNKVMHGETIIVGFRVFVKVDGVNPIKVAMGSEIGDAAALAYHHLPEEKKNDVGRSAARYITLSPAEFSKVIGVAWIAGATRSDRLPPTWVWVALGSDSTKAHIMTRPTLRQWIGTRLADKYIDSFFVERDIVPEWAAIGYTTDPGNDSRYLSLTYPAPRQVLSARYDLRPRVQDNRAQNSAGRDTGMDELSRKFDRLMEFMIEERKEVRQERREQNDLLMRLLPASPK
ncbi:hypothetical protein F5Y13DRAFT_143209 [Hypoxylon sp. FL1857]|nr:hypothetical protein F5Y13DRAFT_143209 [Hypoxylon sp. FL1857]